jgi:hypothetical protein
VINRSYVNVWFRPLKLLLCQLNAPPKGWKNAQVVSAG